ncbi:probable purine permease 4, partial [Dioscorea cayenensis subsp. rotundata]|uniref:Probable purine permease n=1 Tax=Dioscorea cayennensis subsp. rotundata TaxID=55577 RepID=A0AB40AVD9_DIOCR
MAKLSCRASDRLLLAINYALLIGGSVSSTMLTRFYFIHGGSSRWLTTIVQSSAFPLLLIPIIISSTTTSTPIFSNFTPKLLLLCLAIGLLNGVNNLLISWGISYLPVSTSSLILSSQLAFTLILSALLVHQPITFVNLNCVILLTLSSVLLAIGSEDGDRKDGITKLQYFLGFIATVGAALLFSLYLPLVQLVYKRLSKYKMVMEMQVIMQGAATGLALVGMVAGGGVEEVRKEGKGEGEFEYGGEVYWGVVVVVTGVCWQMCFMGTAGLVFLTSSLNCGICMTATLVVNVVGGVVVFGDGFGGVKGVSCVLCLWGFCSYFYGEYRKKKEEEME